MNSVGKADWGSVHNGYLFEVQKDIRRVGFHPLDQLLAYIHAISVMEAPVGLSIVLRIAPGPGRAVDPDQPASSYLRTTFTVEDGLSPNVANAILQTRDGFQYSPSVPRTPGPSPLDNQ